MNSENRKHKIKLWSGDGVYKGIITLAGLVIVSLLCIIFVLLLWRSVPAIKKFGLKFLVNSEWNPVEDQFGALPFIIGTLITSIGAIIISFPLSISTSLFIGEYAPRFLAKLISNMVDLLAAIPSVIYGMWGIFVLVPFIRKVEMFLYTKFSFIPIFNAPPYGVGILSAIVILVIMILPYSISITREVMKQVPVSQKEGAYALGSSRWTMVRRIVIPYCKNGIIGGTTLALGRALGETMAVTMVIGNSTNIPKTLFDPANTIASLIANEFNEAMGEVYLSSLIYLGLILFTISLVINTLGRIIVHKTRMK